MLPPRTRYISDPEAALIVADYRAGLSTPKLAEKYGRVQKHIIARLRREGVFEARPKSNQKLTPEKIEAIRDAYCEGKSLDEAGALVGVSATLAKKALLRQGVLLTNQGGAKFKLTEQHAQQVRDLHAAGASQQEIAGALNVAASTAHNILKRLGLPTKAEQSAVARASPTKRCSHCNTWKPKSEFHGSHRMVDDLSKVCRECQRWRTRKSKYGITRARYEELLASQNGCCAVCGVQWGGSARHMDLVVDHDHTTGQVRGLLCSGCNQGLGHFKDSPALLDAAKAYLAKPVSPATTHT